MKDLRLAFVLPMQPALADSPPEGEEWIHELKYDGYRTQLIVERGEGRAFTRRGHDWSHLYAGPLAAALAFGCERLQIDGEIIVQDEKGLSDFEALRTRLARRRPDGLVFMAFDLLHLDEHDLRRLPIEERRARLKALIGANRPDFPIQYSDHVVGAGATFLALAEQAGAEGIVSKKKGSRYRSGPTRSWLKTKAFAEAEYVVVGTSRGERAPIALLARETDDHRLVYAGSATVNLAEAERERFWRANERLKTDAPALHMAPRPETSWLRPEIRVIVRHLRGEADLRHASVKAISHLPTSSGRAEAERRIVRDRSAKEPGYLVGSGVVPERADLLAYYRRIAPLILPHAAQRPLNLLRCRGRYCFFQRNRAHPASDMPFDPPIRSLPIRQKNGRTEDYLYVDDEAGLLACVEAEAVEFHGWGSRVPDYERPDRIAIDLDPGEGVGFDEVKLTALELRARLARIGLESFAMLTGGKGVHVVLPFAAEPGWDSVRDFAQGLCADLAAEQPERFTTAIATARRRGRIFLDYLRNQRGATAILPYSARVRPGAPVAAPVSWDELPAIASPAAFTLFDSAELARRARCKAIKRWGASDQRLFQ